MVSIGNRDAVLRGIRLGGMPVLTALKKLEQKAMSCFNGGLVRMEVERVSQKNHIILARVRLHEKVTLDGGMGDFDRLTEWWRRYKKLQSHRKKKELPIVVAVAWEPRK